MNRLTKRRVSPASAVIAVLVAFQALIFIPPGFSGRDSIMRHGRLPSAALSAENELSEGKFLVASRKMMDPRFSETVLLLVEYSRRGAVGLILNRPTEVKLSNVWPDMEGLKDRKDTFYIGGPVNMKQIMLLIQSSRQPEDSHNVFKDVYASTSISTLRQLTERPARGERFRVYAGYAGWVAGQLEREISRGDWHVMDANAKMIFDKDPSDIWQELIRKTSADWVKAEQKSSVDRVTKERQVVEWSSS